MKKNKFLISYIFFLTISNIPCIIFAQKTITITGMITDAKTKTPVSYTRVFAEGTTYHTISNKEGIYRIVVPENFKDQITVTNMLYEIQTSKISWDTISTTNIICNFILKEKENTLDEVVFIGNKKKIPKNFENKFWSILLEEIIIRNNKNTVSSQNLTVKNKKDVKLNLNSDQTLFTAYSHEPICIQNNYLGYTIYYYLHKFTWDIPNNRTYREGKSYFEEMKPKNSKQEKEWNENRIKAYQGSMLHLKHVLYNGNYNESHFQAYQVMDKNEIDQIKALDSIPVADNIPQYAMSSLNNIYFFDTEDSIMVNQYRIYVFTPSPLNLSDYVKEGNNPNERVVNFPYNMLVIYDPYNENTIHREYSHQHMNFFGKEEEYNLLMINYLEMIRNRKINYLISNKVNTTLYSDYTLSPANGFYYYSGKYYGSKYLLPRNYVPAATIENNTLLPERSVYEQKQTVNSINEQ